MRTLSLIAIVSVSLALPSSGATLPILSTFDSDSVGLSPSIGGPNQPSGLRVPSGASVLVQSSAFGINSRPVVLDPGAVAVFTSVGYDIPRMSTGVLRVEATVSFDNLLQGYFLQTGVGSSSAVVSRFEAYNGTIFAYGQNVGSFQANVPFRVRMDVDMDSKTWAASIDGNLNGFQDDQVFSGIPFSNDTSVLPYVGFVGADLNNDLNSPYMTRAAYDDISISVVPEPSTFVLIAITLFVLIGRVSRRHSSLPFA